MFNKYSSHPDPCDLDLIPTPNMEGIREFFLVRVGEQLQFLNKYSDRAGDVFSCLSSPIPDPLHDYPHLHPNFPTCNFNYIFIYEFINYYMQGFDYLFVKFNELL